MTKLLVIGLGGFLGAIMRYGLSGQVNRFSTGGFPYGTLVVNVIGCLLLGVIMVLVKDRSFIPPNMQLFITVGLLGAFTTFSTFGNETLILAQDGEIWSAVLNICGSLILGLGAVWLGRVLMRVIIA